jgi:hypothetical protein
MEPRVSFIPKQVLTAEPVRVHRVAAPNLFLVLAIVLLVVCLLFYGGAALYKFLLGRQINQPCEEISAENQVVRCGLLASVEREEKNLNRDTILLLQRVDKKFRLAAALSQNHIDILPVFRLLEELTLPTIAYTKFNFAGPQLKLAGRATKYEDLAVQSDVFAKEPSIKEFVFSELNLNERGEVVFELQLSIDPAVFSYVNRLGS